MRKENKDYRSDCTAIINNGFFCQACLMDKPPAEVSLDPRYCEGCYDFLLKEAELLSGTKRPWWLPRTPQKPILEAVEQASGAGHNYNGSQIGCRIMSTIGDNKIEAKRGSKCKALPQELIRQLAGENMGSRAIASHLKGEMGIYVSYKTIQRVLSGERR